MSESLCPSDKPTEVRAGDILYLPGAEKLRGSIIHSVLKQNERPFGHGVLVTGVQGIYAEILVVTSWSSQSRNRNGDKTTLDSKWKAHLHKGYCQFMHRDRSQSWDANCAGYWPLRTVNDQEFTSPGSYLNMRSPYLVEKILLEHHVGSMRGARLVSESLWFVQGTSPWVHDKRPSGATWAADRDVAIKSRMIGLPPTPPATPEKEPRPSLAVTATAIAPTAVAPTNVAPPAVAPTTVASPAVAPKVVESLAVDPEAVDPVAIDPVVVAAVAVEPVAVIPAAVEAVTVTPVAVAPLAWRQCNPTALSDNPGGHWKPKAASPSKNGNRQRRRKNAPTARQPDCPPFACSGENIPPWRRQNGLH